MHILIKNTRERAAKKHKVLWELFSLPYKRYITVSFIIGAVLIIYSSFSSYSFYTEVTGSGAYINLNFSISIGIAFILLSLIYLIQVLKTRKLFFNRSEKILAYQNQEEVFEATSEYLKVTTTHSKQELKWECFTHYKFKNDILILLMEDSYLHSILIEKTDLNAADFDTLFLFVKQTLIEKR